MGPVARYDSCSTANKCSGFWPLYLCVSGLLSSLLVAWRAHGNENRQRFPWPSTVGSRCSMLPMEEKCSWGVCSQPRHTGRCEEGEAFLLLHLCNSQRSKLFFKHFSSPSNTSAQLLASQSDFVFHNIK